MFAPIRTRAFSLIELVIVIVIIGIIAAIAIPRMSRGAEGAASSSLTANLARLRNAVDLFQAEHNGSYPSATAVVAQLTEYSSAAGATAAAKADPYIYGPYLRAIPALPVGAHKGEVGINGVANGAFAFSATATVGWWYNAETGDVRANTDTEKDAAGKLYNQY